MFEAGPRPLRGTLPSLLTTPTYTHARQVWSSISSGLAAVKLLLASDADAYAALKAFTRRLYGGVAARVGWAKVDGEPHTTSLLRSLVLKVRGESVA